MLKIQIRLENNCKTGFPKRNGGQSIICWLGLARLFVSQWLLCEINEKLAILDQRLFGTQERNKTIEYEENSDFELKEEKKGEIQEKKDGKAVVDMKEDVRMNKFIMKLRKRTVKDLEPPTLDELQESKYF